MFERIQHWLMRQMFAGMGGVIGAGSRIELYETLELLLSNQVQILVALREMYLVESEDGKKKGEVRAIVLYECMKAMELGRPLSSVLENWVPDQEVQLIRAGERSGDMVGVLKSAIRVIEAKGQIVKSVIAGTMYPVILMVIVAILLYQISTNMVPQFARILAPEQWTGAAVILRTIANFVTEYGLISIAVLIGLMGWTFWSLPRLHKTRFRLFLDKIPPWSIYRMLHGSTFLLNIAVMLRAGIGVQEILVMMSRKSSPWLRSRIQAALHGIRDGKRNLGSALYLAGHNFPDKRYVRLLRVIADQDGFDQKLANFGERWLNKAIDGIKTASGIVLGVSLAVAGGLIMLILAGVMSIQQLAQTALAN